MKCSLTNRVLLQENLQWRKAMSSLTYRNRGKLRERMQSVEEFVFVVLVLDVGVVLSIARDDGKLEREDLSKVTEPVLRVLLLVLAGVS